MINEILSQGWWEPGSAGIVDVGDLAAILAFATAILASATALSRWWMKQLKRVIHEEVEAFTEPIQPTANGGFSLPDVSRKVEKLEGVVENVKADLKEDTGRLEKSIEDLRQENRDTWGLLIKHLMNNDDKNA